MSEPEPAPIPAPAPPPRPKAASHAWFGKTIARCKVGERIGRGATSHVFKATYVPLNKEIAVKILSGDRALDQEARARFLGEAKAIARLDHENIVKVLDVVEDQGCVCILMEYVGGQTLQDLLDDEKALAPKRALRTALQVARALEAAHEEEIVHRDIKPANVMLVRGGELVKVVDFGLAVRGVENRVGTPMFMSPEAAQGKRIDDKSDVYALGVCLHQMLTGKLPFGGATVKEILAAHVSKEAAPPSRVQRDLGDRYDALLAKMLVKAKGYRPSAADVVDLLEEMLDEPPEQRGASRRTRRRRGGKKSAAPLAISLGGVAILAVVGIVALVQSSDRPEDAGAVAGGGTKTAEPPPPDPNAVAAAAYNEADAWDREHRTDAEGRVRRWTEFERTAAGTPWAGKGGERRKEAEADAAKQKADREREAADKRAREELEARIKAQHEEVAALVKACDFEGASTRADRLGAPPGTDTPSWNKKVARLRYLKEHFVPKMDAKIKGGRMAASKVKPGAAPDEMVTGATKAGLTTDKGGRIDFASMKPEDLVNGLKRVFSNKPDDRLYLAVLAAELGLDKQAANFADEVRLTDGQGMYADQLREYFK